MPAIPGLPELGVVEKPLMNPREAGKAGAAIAGMGEDIEDMALQSLAIEAHMREAQKKVDDVASSNELNAAHEQTQIELAKTQNSRDIPAVQKAGQDRINDIANKWVQSGSPAGVEIQMKAEGLKPSLDHLSQMRQITLMGKELDSQNTLQMQKLMPDLVTAIRNGDTAQAKAIQDHVSSLWDSPLVSDAEKQTQMEAFREGTQKQVNEAAITSANPQERKQAIQQLRNGGNGPLDLTDFAPGTIAAMRDHALEMDKHLTAQSEAQNLNGALNIKDSAFNSPEYKNPDGTPNFESRQKSLDDGKWLQEHNVVDENGSPDRVMAEKLIADEERLRTYSKQEQADRDVKGADKYDPLIESGKMSWPQIVHLPSSEVSDSLRSHLLSKFIETSRFERQVALQGRQLAEQERQEKSSNIQGQFLMDIAMGKIVDPVTVKTTPGLMSKDGSYIVSAINEAKTHKDYQTGMSFIANNFPIPKGATPEQADRLSAEYADSVKAWTDLVNQHPEQDKVQLAQQVLQPKIQKDIEGRIDQLFGVKTEVDSGSWLVRAPGESWGTWIKRRTGNAPSDPTPPKTTTTEQSAPSGFDVKVKGKDGKWYWGDTRTRKVGPVAE